VLNKLRQKHASGEGANYGVDINTGGMAESFSNFVWEPAVVKINAMNAATEAACLILSVDETVKDPKEMYRMHNAGLITKMCKCFSNSILSTTNTLYYLEGTSVL